MDKVRDRDRGRVRDRGLGLGTGIADLAAQRRITLATAAPSYGGPEPTERIHCYSY